MLAYRRQFCHDILFFAITDFASTSNQIDLAYMLKVSSNMVVNCNISFFIHFSFSIDIDFI